MTDAELNNHVNEWSGEELNWKSEDVIWTATQDGGELIKYFKHLVKKMEQARAEYIAERESNL